MFESISSYITNCKYGKRINHLIIKNVIVQENVNKEISNISVLTLLAKLMKDNDVTALFLVQLNFSIN